MHGDNLKKYCGPKTITLKGSDPIQRQADHPDLQTFMQGGTQRTMSDAFRVDDGIKDGDSIFFQEIPILLSRFDQSQRSKNEECCEEALSRRSLTGKMGGIKAS